MLVLVFLFLCVVIVWFVINFFVMAVEDIAYLCKRYRQWRRKDRYQARN